MLFENTKGKLGIEKIKQYLSSVPSWMLIGDTVQKEFQFKDFKGSMEFVSKIAKIAQEENHHPDIYIFFDKVRLTLTTHSAKGLTENDFILATKINNLTNS